MGGRYDRMNLEPGDLVVAVAATGERIPARVVQGAHTDGELHVVTLCSPEDWATFDTGGDPDYWDEWRYDWPIEAIEPMPE